MPGDAWQALEEAIERGQLARAVDLLEPLDEAERRKLSARARKTAKSFSREDRWMASRGRQRSAVVADAVALGTGGPAAAVAEPWIWQAPEGYERLIRCRSREWRQEWAERVMSESEVRTWHWQLVHELVRDDAIDRPAADGYVIGAVTGMWYPVGDERVPRYRPLTEVLRDRPDWLAHDLWRLFELEEAQLTANDFDHGGRGTWSSALVTLAGEGAIARERLLDASLAALRRDFSPYNARWYHKLHEALEPTPGEHAARLDELLALLASPDPALVGFALRALGNLERAGALPADRLFEALAPALLVPAKGHATRAVKLAGRVLKREPDAATLGVPVLAEGLAHESRDVQELVLDQLERHAAAIGDGARERLAAFAEHADPAVRGRISALAGEPVAAAEPPAGPAVAVPGRRAPRPRTLGEALSPPRDVEELLDRVAVAIERDDDPDELELLLDGISRLRAEAVPEGRARAVVERAGAVSPPWRGEMGMFRARDALIHVLYRWIGEREDRKVRWGALGRSPREAIALRIRELGDDLRSRQPRALLARPSHPGGWIEPMEAVRRIEALDGARPLEMDLAQLVLRVAPDEDGRALAALTGLKGEAAGVLALALGGAAKRPVLSRLKAAWAAAGHARHPAGFPLPDLPRHDPEAHRLSLSGLVKVAELKPASPAELLCLEQSWWGWEPSEIERWLATVWPANREPVHRIVTRRLWINAGTREYGIADVIEHLVDPAEPVGPEAALALALSLGAADAETRAVAADATIAVLRDRRLDGAALGDQLATLLSHQTLAVPARWAPSLADVAAAGPLQAHDVQAAIERILAAAGAGDRRRLVGLVDLLRVLAVDADAAVTDDAARAWLGALGKGSKIGRAGREALAVTGDGAARSRAAVAELEAPTGIEPV